MKRDEGYTSGRETAHVTGDTIGMLSGKNRQCVCICTYMFVLVQTLEMILVGPLHG